eukprot:5877031-Pyramimonas_sp.AAC.1
MAEAGLPDPLPKTRVSDGSQLVREALALHLVDVGIATVPRAEERARVRGEALLNGFAGEKRGTPRPRASRVARPTLDA